MKKFLALVLAVLMVFSCVTGCAKKDGPSLADAVAYLESLYKDGAKETPVDYDVVAKVLVNNVEFNVTWETDNENISVKESDKAGFFTVDVPDKTEAEIPYKLKATIKEGLKSETVEFDRVVPIVDNTELVDKPEENVAYKFYLVQANLEQTLYATAETENDKYIKTTMDPKAGIDFFVEEVEGGFKFYTMIDGAKKYLTAAVKEVEEGKFSKFVYYSTEGSVWYYKPEVRAWFTSINGGEYVVGTYNSYKTISISEASYINKDNSGKTQFPLTLIKKEVAESKTPNANIKIYETAKEILEAAYALEPGKYLSGGWDYTLTGKIISIDTPYSTQYGNVTVTIVVDGMTDKPIQLFRLKGDGADKLEVGNTVTARGPIVNYAFKDDEGNVTGSKVEMEQPTLVKHNGTGEGAQDTTVDVKFEAVTAPKAGEAYKFFIAQNGTGKLLYLKGTTQNNEGKFIETTTKAKEAVDVYVEKVSGGYKFYATIGGVKKYIKASTKTSVGDDGTEKTSKFLGWESTGSVFYYKSAENAWFTKIGGAEYVIGTYGTYDTASLSDAKYISKDNTGKTQYPLGLVSKKAAEQAVEVKPEEKPAPVGGSVFTYKSDIKAWVTTVGKETFYVGSYGTFDTLSLSATSYINKDNTGETQFPASIVTKTSNTAVTAPKANTAYKLYMNQVQAGKKVYALGKATTSENKYIATTETKASAVDVYAEKVSGGYKFYIKNGSEKKYLTAHLIGQSKYIYWAGKNVTPGGSGSGSGTTTPVKPVEPEFEAVTAPNTTDVYKIYFIQGNKGTLTYATDELDQGKYIVMDADPKNGIDFKAEKVSGGYKFYTTISGAKKYLASYLVLEEGKTNKSKYIGYNNTGSVYKYNAEAKAWITTIEGTDYVIGTYNNFETMSTSEAKYLFEESSKANQFPAQLVLKSAAEKSEIVVPEEPESNDPAANSTLTIAQAIALGNTKEKDNYTTNKYYIEGVIDSVTSTTYGNMYVKDSEGNKILVYGLYDESGARYDALATKPVAGDTVKLYGVIGKYNEAQMKNATLVAHTPAQGGGSETPDPEQPGGGETPDPEVPTYAVVDTPVAGTAYKFGMIQQNVSTTDVYYINGAMSTYYMATTTDASTAVDVYLEETTGGYYLYAMVDGAKKYINMVVSGTHVNGAFEDTASTVYTYDATSKTVISTVSEAPYWIGTRNDKTYTTVGPVKTEFNGFYLQFYAATGSTTPEQPGGGETPDPETPVVLTPAEIVNAAYGLAAGATLENGPYTLTGIITAVTEPYNSEYGNITVNIVVEALGNKAIQLRRMSVSGDVLAAGDTVTVTGNLQNYNGTVQMYKPTLDSYKTASQIIDILYALENRAETTEKYALTGVITSIPSGWSEQFANITVNMSVAGDTRTVQAFRIKGEDAAGEVIDDVKNLAVGDTITVYGTLKNYDGTYEIATPELVAVTKAPTTEPENPGQGGGETQSTTATLTAGATYGDDTAINNLSIDSVITISGEQGTHTNSVPRSYKASNGTYSFRIYKGNLLTISAAEGYKITSIVATSVGTNNGLDKATPSVGTITANGTTQTLSDISAQSVAFTGTASMQILSFVVTYVADGATGGGETPDPEQPGGETPDPEVPTYAVVDTPVAGTAYKFGMIQQNVSTTDVYYINGAMSTYYMDTTTDASAAVDVYLEETTGGYYLYAMVDGAKKYINMVVSGTHVNGAFEDTASTVYTYDATSKTIISTVNEAPYWIGTRNDKTYTTVGPVKTEFNGFYLQFYAAAGSSTPEQPGGGSGEGSESATPTTVELTIENSGLSGTMTIPTLNLDDVITFSAVKANGQNDPKFYSTGTFRIYANNTLTVTAAAGYKILSVEATASGSSYLLTNGTFSGTATTDGNVVTVSGINSSSWTLTGPASGQIRFSNFKVTYVAE